jgi:IS605 OrfB family transposase
MLIYEYKLDGRKRQYAAIDEAIRITQFIRNKCLRLWVDVRGTKKNDLQCYCALLAKEYPYAVRLNSQARQASADRAWFAIARFYDNCKTHQPGKKGYPRFQHDNRSVEYKQTGWKLEADGKHICFTDGCSIGRLRLVGNPCQHIETFPTKQIKRGADCEACRWLLLPVCRRCLLIAYEDLQIANLVKNRKLAKSISDASWGRFLSWLTYYGRIQNIPVIAVEPAFTSQDCSACGTRVKKSLSVRTHICSGCGLALDRDHNAAINILAKALLNCTGGQSGTGGQPQNAWGEVTSTALSAVAILQAASWNQEPSVL